MFSFKSFAQGLVSEPAPGIGGQKPTENSDCDTDPDSAFPAALSGSQNGASGPAGIFTKTKPHSQDG
jgi:hypothetical protein